MKEAFASDGYGNKVIMDEVGNLTLHLVSKTSGKKVRNIGVISKHPDGKILYTKHENEKDIFKKTTAWSINYAILCKVDYVKFVTDTVVYKIIAEKAKELGSFLWFKDQGIEKKIYVPLKYWHKSKKRMVAKL